MVLPSPPQSPARGADKTTPVDTMRNLEALVSRAKALEERISAARERYVVPLMKVNQGTMNSTRSSLPVDRSSVPSATALSTNSRINDLSSGGELSGVAKGEAEISAVHDTVMHADIAANSNPLGEDALGVLEDRGGRLNGVTSPIIPITIREHVAQPTSEPLSAEKLLSLKDFVDDRSIIFDEGKAAKPSEGLSEVPLVEVKPDCEDKIAVSAESDSNDVEHQSAKLNHIAPETVLMVDSSVDMDILGSVAPSQQTEDESMSDSVPPVTLESALTLDGQCHNITEHQHSEKDGSGMLSTEAVIASDHGDVAAAVEREVKHETVHDVGTAGESLDFALSEGNDQGAELLAGTVGEDLCVGAEAAEIAVGNANAARDIIGDTKVEPSTDDQRSEAEIEGISEEDTPRHPEQSPEAPFIANAEGVKVAGEDSTVISEVNEKEQYSEDGNSSADGATENAMGAMVETNTAVDAENMERNEASSIDKRDEPPLDINDKSVLPPQNSGHHLADVDMDHSAEIGPDDNQDLMIDESAEGEADHNAEMGPGGNNDLIIVEVEDAKAESAKGEADHNAEIGLGDNHDLMIDEAEDAKSESAEAEAVVEKSNIKIEQDLPSDNAVEQAVPEKDGVTTELDFADGSMINEIDAEAAKNEETAAKDNVMMGPDFPRANDDVRIISETDNAETAKEDSATKDCLPNFETELPSVREQALLSDQPIDFPETEEHNPSGNFGDAASQDAHPEADSAAGDTSDSDMQLEDIDRTSEELLPAAPADVPEEGGNGETIHVETEPEMDVPMSENILRVEEPLKDVTRDELPRELELPENIVKSSAEITISAEDNCELYDVEIGSLEHVIPSIEHDQVAGDDQSPEDMIESPVQIENPVELATLVAENDNKYDAETAPLERVAPFMPQDRAAAEIADPVDDIVDHSHEQNITNDGTAEDLSEVKIEENDQARDGETAPLIIPSFDTSSAEAVAMALSVEVPNEHRETENSVHLLSDMAPTNDTVEPKLFITDDDTIGRDLTHVEPSQQLEAQESAGHDESLQNESTADKRNNMGQVIDVHAEIDTTGTEEEAQEMAVDSLRSVSPADEGENMDTVVDLHSGVDGAGKEQSLVEVPNADEGPLAAQGELPNDHDGDVPEMDVSTGCLDKNIEVVPSRNQLLPPIVDSHSEVDDTGKEQSSVEAPNADDGALAGQDDLSGDNAGDVPDMEVPTGRLHENIDVVPSWNQALQELSAFTVVNGEALPKAHNESFQTAESEIVGHSGDLERQPTAVDQANDLASDMRLSKLELFVNQEHQQDQAKPSLEIPIAPVSDEHDEEVEDEVASHAQAAEEPMKQDCALPNGDGRAIGKQQALENDLTVIENEIEPDASSSHPADIPANVEVQEAMPDDAHEDTQGRGVDIPLIPTTTEIDSYISDSQDVVLHDHIQETEEEAQAVENGQYVERNEDIHDSTLQHEDEDARESELNVVACEMQERDEFPTVNDEVALEHHIEVERSAQTEKDCVKEEKLASGQDSNELVDDEAAVTEDGGLNLSMGEDALEDIPEGQSQAKQDVNLDVVDEQLVTPLAGAMGEEPGAALPSNEAALVSFAKEVERVAVDSIPDVESPTEQAKLDVPLEVVHNKLVNPLAGRMEKEHDAANEAELAYSTEILPDNIPEEGLDIALDVVGGQLENLSAGSMPEKNDAVLAFLNEGTSFTKEDAQGDVPEQEVGLDVPLEVVDDQLVDLTVGSMPRENDAALPSLNEVEDMSSTQEHDISEEAKSPQEEEGSGVPFGNELVNLSADTTSEKALSTMGEAAHAADALNQVTIEHPSDAVLKFPELPAEGDIKPSRFTMQFSTHGPVANAETNPAVTENPVNTDLSPEPAAVTGDDAGQIPDVLSKVTGAVSDHGKQVSGADAFVEEPVVEEASFNAIPTSKVVDDTE